MINPLWNLQGRVALVTGASRGLGTYFAEALAKAGAKVVLGARDVERLSNLAERIEAEGGRALPVGMDVADPESVKRAIELAQTELGPLRIVINNAGVVADGSALNASLDDWDRVINTNLRGAWLTAQASAQAMRDHGEGGSIVNIASILGLQGSQQVASYCASKGGLINLTRALAAEWARYGIRVNALAPGYIKTDINQDFLDSKAGEHLRKAIPQRRFGRFQDLEGPLFLLASDAGAYMTGAVLVVDGGHSSTL
ncbi:SDR family NAD(P)-dependent oxidoreductase [Limibacillus sp. MBR-115]|jgi:NAD(P)-dependent dehydrogenase (short-subunit alcohol dehydrogenase family)|uniref:SDR family NAD(P)-dependent oxidoreductase n=1 Tax=Limibacillus sp. MBR-115 TaxID=3156465 RepID=UPI003394EB36